MNIRIVELEPENYRCNICKTKMSIIYEVPDENIS